VLLLLLFAQQPAVEGREEGRKGGRQKVTAVPGKTFAFIYLLARVQYQKNNVLLLTTDRNS